MSQCTYSNSYIVLIGLQLVLRNLTYTSLYSTPISPINLPISNHIFGSQGKYNNVNYSAAM